MSASQLAMPLPWATIPAPACGLGATIPAPALGYGTVSADPPWRFDDQGGRMKTPYPTMSDAALERLAAETIRRLLAADAHLWIWTTDAHLPLACRMLELAETRLVCTFVWGKVTRKDRFVAHLGGGHYLRHAHELALLGVRGKATALDRSWPTMLLTPRARHSAKPAEFYRMLERVSPGPDRLELFARDARDGWARWGNEAP